MGVLPAFTRDNRMNRRPLGNTGLEVSKLGIGLAEIGMHLSPAEQSRAAVVLNTALDNGVNLLDTAACYGNSEELIGDAVSHRRDEYILATKCGHVAGDEKGEAWTGPTVARSIDRSLRRLKTDRVDIVQLHSCAVDVLEKGEVIRALEDAREAGKTRFISYSGDNEAAAWAVDSGIFATLQTTLNLVDQNARRGLLEAAHNAGMGVIIKRPIANGIWGGGTDQPRATSRYDDINERVMAMMNAGPVAGAPDDRILLALGFTFAHPQVDTAIVGTTNPDHLLSNIELINSGLGLADGVVEELYRRFDSLGADWHQIS